jgi:hypothetical protein
MLKNNLVNLRYLLTLFVMLFSLMAQNALTSQKIVLGGFFLDVHSFLRLSVKKNEHPMKSP